MAQQQFDLIVFDWDGTLMDSTLTIVRCIQRAAEDLKLPIPSDQEAAHVIGLGLNEAMQAVLPGIDSKYYPKMVERYRHHYFAQDQDLFLFHGCESLLEELRQLGYLLAVATGKSRAGLNRALLATGRVGFFHATRCADETFSKPHPRMLHELSVELDQEIERVVMIGDTTHDLQMANNAGAAGIGVAYGAHFHEELKACNPKFVAHSVAQLREWLIEHA
jgi:phosphoglycolate phosphatase